MPNLFLDVRGLAERLLKRPVKRDEAAQGMILGQGHVAQKMIFGPMLVKNLVDGSLPARKGIQYYIHSISLTASTVVTDTFTLMRVVGQVGGIPGLTLLSVGGVTLTAQSVSNSNVLDCITDVGTSVSRTDVGTLSYEAAIVTYQEVTVENA